ncbi:hypothetical protein SAMN04487944_13214 [Gracilibacillus ureilyticus]|uniref:Uncharacterized protein n=1 Tax=Gracilibacillus ureilyticus TaxID=531814 RepID=A0A1H9W1G9_9BACI|nr:hypothetical protein SAMN04487944_13214 [Gracilibacillus ureilyticus]
MIAIAFIFSTIINISEKLTNNLYLRFLIFHIIGLLIVLIIYRWVPILIFFAPTSYLSLPIYYFAHNLIKKRQESQVTISENDEK